MGLIRCIPHKLIDYITNKLKVSLYAKGEKEGDTAVAVVSKNYPNLRSQLYYNNNTIVGGSTSEDEISTESVSLDVRSKQLYFNGNSWDRVRNNVEFTLLELAKRNSTTWSPKQTNYNARGVLIFANVTQVASSGTIKLYVDVYDPLSNLGRILASMDITSEKLHLLLIYPGADGTNSSYDMVVNAALPRTWNVGVIHNTNEEFTYSVSGCYIL